MKDNIRNAKSINDLNKENDRITHKNISVIKKQCYHIV